MKTLVYTAALLLCTACQAFPPLPVWQSPRLQDAQRTGQIVETSTGQVLDVRQLVQRLSQADVLLLGEKHDNLDHHRLQLWLLQAMAQQREQGSVVFEMLTLEQQPLVDKAQHMFATGQKPDDLPQVLQWSPGWDWQQYGDLIGYSLAQPGRVLASNLSRDELRAIYRHPPALAQGAASRPDVQQKLHEHIFTAHCGKLPQEQVPAMVAVQQQRDLSMARILVQAAKPTVLIAGAYHVRKDMGVPLHLQDMRFSGTAKVLIFAEADQELDKEQADFIWYTAATEEQDYCADL